ncbi:MAG: hypothetical protein HIU88_12655 [Acidobacteria bacterium]|nr:hypothetical protein [Acidobacteriota bacterium]
MTTPPLADAEGHQETGDNPYADPSWEPAIVWVLRKLHWEWPEAGFTEEEIDEIPDLDPLPSETEHGVRLSYGQYGAALAITMAIEDDDDYAVETVAESSVLTFALRRLGFDPAVGVAEWAAWKASRPATVPFIAST